MSAFRVGHRSDIGNQGGAYALTGFAAAVERAMKRQEVILRALSGALTWLQAADILGIDPRSLRRRWARYENDQQLGLYDRRQLPSSRKAPVGEVHKIVRLYRGRTTGSTYGTSTIICADAITA